jgi:hypothetical protein
MPAKQAAPKETPKPAGVALTISEPLVVGETGTVTVTGAPPDTAIDIGIAAATGGVDIRSVVTDDHGGAEVSVVPQMTGDSTVLVTQITTTVLAEATVTVSGSRPPVALALTSIEPTEAEVGPPDSFLLVATGAGFDINTRMSFGVFSAEEAEAGLGEEGEPKWEGTRYISDTQVGIDVSAGQFPNADPAVPVQVGKGEETAGPVDFAFVEPPPPEEPAPVEEESE